MYIYLKSLQWSQNRNYFSAIAYSFAVVNIKWEFNNQYKKET